MSVYHKAASLSCRRILQNQNLWKFLDLKEVFCSNRGALLFSVNPSICQYVCLSTNLTCNLWSVRSTVFTFWVLLGLELLEDINSDNCQTLTLWPLMTLQTVWPWPFDPEWPHKPSDLDPERPHSMGIVSCKLFFNVHYIQTAQLFSFFSPCVILRHVIFHMNIMFIGYLLSAFVVQIVFRL